MNSWKFCRNTHSRDSAIRIKQVKHGKPFTSPLMLFVCKSIASYIPNNQGTFNRSLLLATITCYSSSSSELSLESSCTNNAVDFLMPRLSKVFVSLPGNRYTFLGKFEHSWNSPGASSQASTKSNTIYERKKIETILTKRESKLYSPYVWSGHYSPHV